MKQTKTTSIAFTAQELEQLSAALNARWCDCCEKSDTYGNADAIREGHKDYFESLCDILIRLELRVWKAQKRIENR